MARESDTQEADRLTPTPETTAPISSLPLPRILVADDDRMNILIIASALKGEFEVAEGECARRKSERAHQNTPYVLISSYRWGQPAGSKKMESRDSWNSCPSPLTS